MRIEDFDAPRCVPGAAEGILQTLESCGLTWDGAVHYQSRRLALYEAALERLKSVGRAYPCACTRREVEHRYPGTCRNGLHPGRTGRSWRFRVESGLVQFDDRLQGRQLQDVETEVGDFVLLRADGVWAYQLAVVVDDAMQGITDVVRGVDLLHSTARRLARRRPSGLGPAALVRHFPARPASHSTA